MGADNSSSTVLQLAVCLRECDRETWIMRRPWVTRDSRTFKKIDEAAVDGAVLSQD